MNADSGMAYNYATGKIAILSQENAAVWVGTIVHAPSFIYHHSENSNASLRSVPLRNTYLLVS